MGTGGSVRTAQRVALRCSAKNMVASRYETPCAGKAFVSRTQVCLQETSAPSLDLTSGAPENKPTPPPADEARLLFLFVSELDTFLFFIHP